MKRHVVRASLIALCWSAPHAAAAQQRERILVMPFENYIKGLLDMLKSPQA